MKPVQKCKCFSRILLAIFVLSGIFACACDNLQSYTIDDIYGFWKNKEDNHIIYIHDDRVDSFSKNEDKYSLNGTGAFDAPTNEKFSQYTWDVSLDYDPSHFGNWSVRDKTEPDNRLYGYAFREGKLYYYGIMPNTKPPAEYTKCEEIEACKRILDRMQRAFDAAQGCQPLIAEEVSFFEADPEISKREYVAVKITNPNPYGIYYPDLDLTWTEGDKTYYNSEIEKEQALQYIPASESVVVVRWITPRMSKDAYDLVLEYNPYAIDIDGDRKIPSVGETTISTDRKTGMVDEAQVLFEGEAPERELGLDVYILFYKDEELVGVGEDRVYIGGEKGNMLVTLKNFSPVSEYDRFEVYVC